MLVFCALPTDLGHHIHYANLLGHVCAERTDVHCPEKGNGMQLPIPRHLIAAATLAFIVGTAVPGNAFAADGSTDLADDNQVVAEVVSSEDNETSNDNILPTADVAGDDANDVSEGVNASVPDVTAVTEDGTEDENSSEPADATSDDVIAEAAESTTSEIDAPEADAELLTTMSDEEARNDGTYVLSSRLDNKMVLDVLRNESKDGANVQIYTSNGTAAQKWNVRYVADGLYNILKYNTNMALSIANGVVKNGANVELRKLDSTGTDGSQLWSFVDLNNGYYNIVSSLDSRYVLDIWGSKAKNCQNVQVWNSNNTKAQQFKMFESKIADPSDSNIPITDGTYTLKCAYNKNWSVDITNGSKASGTNAQLYSSNSSQAQKFYFKPDGKGYYTITVIGSAKVLSAVNASPIAANNVVQSTYTGADIQKWALHKHSDSNGYEIVNKATGLSLDVSGGVYSKGRNIQTYYRNNSEAQRFALDRTNALSNGIYAISSLLNTNKMLDIEGGSTASGTPLQIYSSNSVPAQRFGVEILESSDGKELYMIKTAASGGYLTTNSNPGDVAVVQRGSHSTASNDYNTWELIWNGTYFSMRNVAKGKVLDIPGGNTSSGKDLQVYSANGTTAQHFYFNPANLLVNGTYLINSTVPNQKLVLDVANASKSYDENIQAYTKSGHIAQQFTITAVNSTSDLYVIKNVNSGMAVSIKLTEPDPDSVVQKSYNSNLESQKWKAEIGDGGSVIFINWLSVKYGNSDMALTVSGGTSAQPRANVYQDELVTGSSRKAQQWKLTRIGWYVSGNTYRYYDINGDATSFNASSYDSWKRYKDRTSNTKYLMVIDRDRCWANIYTKVAGQWQPLKSWRCAVGSKGSPTPVGEWLTSGRRGTTHVDVEYTAKWVIEVKSPWAFNIHSTPFKPDGRVLTARLGAWITGGCCRLAVDNAHWVYDNIRGGTRVITY